MGTSSQGVRLRSTTVTVSAMQTSPNSSGRGDQNGAPMPTVSRPAAAVRSGEPVRANRSTSQARAATSTACSSTTSR